MTKTEAKRVARRARVHGYHDRAAAPGSPRRLYVFCPICHERVESEYDPWRSITAVLDRAMLDHLADKHEAA